MQETQMQKKVELKETREIELPSLDVSKYIGMKAKIGNVGEYEGGFGYYVKVETQVLDVLPDIKDKEGKPLSLRASRVFGLQEDADGNIGWGRNTKLGLFLQKMKCSHYRELVGKEVVVQTVTSKDGQDFLSFN